MRQSAYPLWLVLVTVAGPTLAGPCDSLTTPRELRLKDSLANYLQITQTFRVTLNDGLTARPFAAVSRRLLDFGCWLIRASDTTLTYEQLALTLAQRYRSLEGDSVFSIDTTALPFAGDSAAPVTIALYMSVGCGHCRTQAQAIVREVTHGRLKGKARVFIRTAMPTIAEKSLYAAHRCNDFWGYFTYLMAQNQGFDKETALVKGAKKAGLDPACFGKALADTALGDLCRASFFESARNGVNSIPAWFINGRRYLSEPSAQWVADAAEYAWETAPRRTR